MHTRPQAGALSLYPYAHVPCAVVLQYILHSSSKCTLSLKVTRTTIDIDKGITLVSCPEQYVPHHITFPVGLRSPTQAIEGILLRLQQDLTTRQRRRGGREAKAMRRELGRGEMDGDDDDEVRFRHAHTLTLPLTLSPHVPLAPSRTRTHTVIHPHPLSPRPSLTLHQPQSTPPK